jgi:hypothetical protein
MTTPTPQDFYHLQEQFTQMQQMMSQLASNSQSTNQPPQSDFDVVKLFLKPSTTGITLRRYNSCTMDPTTSVGSAK